MLSFPPFSIASMAFRAIFRKTCLMLSGEPSTTSGFPVEKLISRSISLSRASLFNKNSNSCKTYYFTGSCFFSKG